MLKYGIDVNLQPQFSFVLICTNIYSLKRTGNEVRPSFEEGYESQCSHHGLINNPRSEKEAILSGARRVMEV